MELNRIKEHLSNDFDKQIADTFAPGYCAGVWDTMQEHKVFTDPGAAAMNEFANFKRIKKQFLKMFYDKGDIMEIDTL